MITQTIAYLELIEADEYFSMQLDNNRWICHSTLERQKSLYKATDAINKLTFIGCKTELLQPNAFPRSPDTLVPDAIKIATCRCAIEFLKGFDPEFEARNLIKTSSGYAGVTTGYNPQLTLVHIKNGIPSIQAWDYLRPYLIDPRSVQLRRV